MQELPFSAKPSPLLHSPVPPRLGGGRERRALRLLDTARAQRGAGHCHQILCSPASIQDCSTRWTGRSGTLWVNPARALCLTSKNVQPKFELGSTGELRIYLRGSNRVTKRKAEGHWVHRQSLRGKGGGWRRGWEAGGGG